MSGLCEIGLTVLAAFRLPNDVFLLLISTYSSGDGSTAEGGLGGGGGPCKTGRGNAHFEECTHTQRERNRESACEHCFVLYIVLSKLLLSL